MSVDLIMTILTFIGAFSECLWMPLKLVNLGGKQHEVGIATHAAVLDTKNFISKFKSFIHKGTLLRERELAYFITPFSDTAAQVQRDCTTCQNRPALELGIKTIQILLT